jgi:transposase-like protein
LNGLQGWPAKVPLTLHHLAPHQFKVATRIEEVALVQNAIEEAAFLCNEDLFAKGLTLIFGYRHRSSSCAERILHMHLKTLQDAFQFFSAPQNCIDTVVKMRWPDGKVTCPTCGSENVTWLASRKLFQCKTRHKKCQFSVRVGTIMEDSPIRLGDWLIVTWMLMNCRNGISSYEVARTIGITQKSAWFMLHRLRKAMSLDQAGKMGGAGAEVEVDEAYIGGKPQNMHKRRKLELQQERNEVPAWKNRSRYMGKTPVMGMFDRTDGQVRALVVPDTSRKTLEAEVVKNVEPGSLVYTDQAVAYYTLQRDYVHQTITHIDDYVRGSVHTNCLENFWSCLKRTLRGTYVCVSPKHLGAYVAEQGFRFNHRKGFTEHQRFGAVLEGVKGKRLTYKELTAGASM